MIQSAIGLAPAIALALALGARDTDTPFFKCGTIVPGDPVVFIDGVIRDVSPGELDLKAEDVYSIEILCMNPRDSTLNAYQGIPAISIWTKDWPSVVTKAAFSGHGAAGVTPRRHVPR